MVYLDVLASQGNQFLHKSPECKFARSWNHPAGETLGRTVFWLFQNYYLFRNNFKASEKADRIDEAKMHKSFKPGSYNTEIRTTPESTYNWSNFACYNPGT